MSRCLEDVLSIPIDYPNYIQLEDMNQSFLDPLSDLNLGLEKRDNRYLHIEDLKRPERPVVIEPLKKLLEFIEKRKLRDVVRGARACVTGPFTLSSQVEKEGLTGRFFKGSIIQDIGLVEQMAEVVSRVAYFYGEEGSTFINIDEPILSLVVGRKFLFDEYTEDLVIKILDTSIGRVKTPTGIHVCGTLSTNLMNILCQSEIDVLDHEFYDCRRNLNIFTKRDLERHDKKISFGSLSSKQKRVEPEEEVEAFMRVGLRTFGEENILFFKPDCGFRGLGTNSAETYEITIEKLRNLKRAKDRL
ncbi:MAG: hypothetical protein GTO54_10870 [Nitrososphaeria archaeon]|nr:hypothetical protein [Nitrososphaeria archaeon]